MILPTDIRDQREQWLTRARRLAPLVSSEAIAVERAGQLTSALLDAFRREELFWSLLPKDWGGGEIDIVTALQVVEEISRADGSVGWTLMANMTGGAVACAYLPDRALDTFFGDGRRPIFAGMLSPKGSAVPVDRGYSITGRYGFGSGISHADVVGGGFFVRENGVVRSRPSGEPDVRTFFVPRAGVRLHGNWDVIGLSGTGSVDYEITEQIVEEHFGFLLPDPVPTRPIPAYQLGLVPFGGAGHGAVAIGIAMRAMAELAVLSRRKRRPGMAVLADQQLFLHDFAAKEASLQAARAFFYDTFGAAHDAATRTGQVSTVQKQRLRQVVTYGTNVAADVVRWCYTWGGSDSLREPSALGRCFRDIAAATQHMFVDPNTLASVAPDLIAHWAEPPGGVSATNAS